MRKFLFILICWLHLGLKAQYQQSARITVDSLTSPYMNGRGYVDDGIQRAADFIKNEFEKAGLQKFNNIWNQTLKMDINTFPDTVRLKIDGNLLETGKDFIVKGYSKPARGKFKLLVIDSSFIQSEQKLKKFYTQENHDIFLVVKTKEFGQKNFEKLLACMHGSDALNTAGLIEITQGKLTMDVSQEQSVFTHIILKETSYSENAKQIETIIESELKKYYKIQNIIGFVPGEIADSFIVFTGHYDHLGQLGDGVYFPGANDNASGIAMLLELAKYYAQPANKPKYSIAFIAFSGEEAGLAGSKYYVENPVFELERIKFLINMDILGTGDEGIKVVNGAVHTNEFDRLVQFNAAGNYLKSVQPRGKAANSDHYFFSENNVPAFFIYTLGGIDAYHDIYDRPETLPLTEFDDLFKLLTNFADSF